MTAYRYFQAVFHNGQFQQYIATSGLVAEGVKSQRANPVIKLYRSGGRWLVNVGPVPGLCVHIELRHRGAVGIDVELFPYQPFRPKVAEEDAMGDPLLMRKMAITDEIRQAVMSHPDLIYFHQGYRKGWRSDTLMAIKVHVSTEDSSPDEYVTELLPKINILASLIDKTLHSGLGKHCKPPLDSQST